MNEEPLTLSLSPKGRGDMSFPLSPQGPQGRGDMNEEPPAATADRVLQQIKFYSRSSLGFRRRWGLLHSRQRP